MIAKTYIKRTLKSLDYRYRQSNTKLGPYYYSKLAVIELCGWIELAQDDIVKKSAKRCFGNSSQYSRTLKIVEGNYGFRYEENFGRMLRDVFGRNGLLEVELKCDPIKLHGLKSELGALAKSRNRLAHTYINGTTVSIAAPSLTIEKFSSVLDGLVEFEQRIHDSGF